MRLVALIFLLLMHSESKAHEVWANNEVVPPWVKSSCCGPDDVHHLDKGQVHATPEGWRVDGYPTLIAYGKELPSQDGDYWIFYKYFGPGMTPEYTPVYCFFVPAQAF